MWRIDWPVEWHLLAESITHTIPAQANTKYLCTSSGVIADIQLYPGHSNPVLTFAYSVVVQQCNAGIKIKEVLEYADSFTVNQISSESLHVIKMMIIRRYSRISNHNSIR